MEWLTRLQGSIVTIDTAPFIYLVERSPRYLSIIQPLFQALDRGDFAGVTSTLTVLEVLVHPLRSNNTELVHSYRDILLNARNLQTLDLTPAVAEEAARLRASLGLKTPDAVQLATARDAGATTLVTNDRAIRSVPGLSVVQLDEIPTGSTE